MTRWQSINKTFKGSFAMNASYGIFIENTITVDRSDADFAVAIGTS